MRIVFIGHFQKPSNTDPQIARALSLLGHRVTPVEQNSEPWTTTYKRCERADQLWWMKTGTCMDPRRILQNINQLERRGIPTVGVHLDRWHGLSREQELVDHPFFRMGTVFTADGGHQKEFAALGINHHWMPPAIDDRFCELAEDGDSKGYEIGFFGTTRNYHKQHTWRPQMLSELKRSFGGQVGIWGRGAMPEIRLNSLNAVIAGLKVVVGDACSDGTGPPRAYFSDRVPETLGRGGILVHPRVEGLEKHYTEGLHYIGYDMYNVRSFRDAVTQALDMNEAERDRMRLAAVQHTRSHHLWQHRMEQVLRTLG